MMPRKVRPYGSAVDAESAGLRSRTGGGAELLSGLASLLTVRELAGQAAESVHALADLAAEGEDLRSLGEVRDVLDSLELMSHGLPRLCEQLARFVVTQREDGQLPGPGRAMAEVTAALTAAGQAADMLAEALDQARRATSALES